MEPMLSMKRYPHLMGGVVPHKGGQVHPNMVSRLVPREEFNSKKVRMHQDKEVGRTVVYPIYDLSRF